MPSTLHVCLAVGALVASTAAGLVPMSATSMAADSAAMGVPQAAEPDGDTTGRPTQTRLEVWLGPNRIGRMKPGHSRTITVQAVETMAVWDSVRAVVTARATAGKISPKEATTKSGHPAKFELTRTRDGNFGFVTFTATSRTYGTAKRNLSWGKVRLPQRLTGTLTHVNHEVRRTAGVPYVYGHTREQWHVTFQLVTRSSRKWFRAAVYRLAGGSWQAQDEFRTGDTVCAGQGQGPAATGSLRYDWRGTKTSSGAGLYWLDLGSNRSYRVHCTTHDFDALPRFTLGLDPATNGIHPDHFQGARRTQLVGPNQDANVYESWKWELRAS